MMTFQTSRIRRKPKYSWGQRDGKKRVMLLQRQHEMQEEIGAMDV
jgi:hypothetical protein